MSSYHIIWHPAKKFQNDIESHGRSVYDLLASKGAKLCSNAKEALENGKCDGCAGLKAMPGVGAEKICPLGFWCMRMVIERHAVRGEHNGKLRGAPHALRAAPESGRDEVQVLRGALLAASKKVDEVQTGTIGRVLDKLKEATAQHAVQVETWKDWLDAIGKDPPPSLLVLLPHTSEVRMARKKRPQLEIGQSQVLQGSYLTSEFLSPSSTSATKPVVFLLGCSTEDPKLGVANLTVEFQDLGAAIVLSTLTPVLGHQVGPVTEALVEHLKETVEKKTAAKVTTFGYAMRALSYKELAQGNVMVLCLVSHGDAQWRLAPADRR